MYAEDYIENKIPNVSVVKVEATYLLWIDCKQVLGNSSELCRFLRKTTGLYLSDGVEYRNGEGFLRMNLVPVGNIRNIKLNPSISRQAQKVSV